MPNSFQPLREILEQALLAQAAYANRTGIAFTGENRATPS